jgi:membrane-associated phospholipid phosphatase
MLKNIGISISYLLHPMVISTLTFWFVIYQMTLTTDEPNLIFFISFFFSTLLPIVVVLYLKNQSLVSDIDVSNRKERLLPMAFGALSFLIGFVILRQINSPMIIQGIMFCNLINTILMWLITKHWKISIHTLAIASALTIFWVLGFKYVIISSLLLILTIIARILTKAHTLSQSLVGIVVGIISTYSQLILFFL